MVSSGGHNYKIKNMNNKVFRPIINCFAFQLSKLLLISLFFQSKKQKKW